jgi:hypothetical protein
MRKRESNLEDNLRPHYDLEKLEVVAYGPGWTRRRRLRKKGRARAVSPKQLVAIPNPALIPKTAPRKA